MGRKTRYLKYLLPFVLFSLMFIVSCNNASNRPNVDYGYYSSDPHQYNLLVLLDASKASDTDWYKWEEENNLLNVIDKINGEPTTLKKAQNKYKTLNVGKLPYYVVFDTKGVAYQTNSEQNLVDFLQKNKP